ncbi:mitochondrial distribution and morphology protein 10 [Punctularia strigosozonata HHB-11173 SS5]|uniref:mitochondrial distribution and morphology protein 10 n=1 Tax=Punctularia strigosozonata (strain HHB-11173) TaxID=741275 RepID=UPI0004416923|nr:mitochondrial distribution and morphology protein 10 [Punctularia strigosozonata HHB-11173 SS5]EIN10609.1 mitochondrial distribution and morphology protein 10 [Punctularia strigosozonata HHB-11173 SS5]
MHPFASYVLRAYYRATGWNEDNLYSNLTRSSNAILDFNVPRGLHFSVSKSPNALFKTSYSMNALPSLNGSVGYIFTSCDLDIKNSGEVRFKDMVDRFKVYDQPRRPEGKEEVWLAGERVDTRADYLLYGRFYLPAGRLDALYSTRISPTLQALVAAISDPPSAKPSNNNVMFSLQHDVGKWCTEYSWSAEDSMWGVRVLHNFGKRSSPSEYTEDGERGQHGEQPGRKGLKRIDEEEAMEGGLKGRFSAGAELYFSAKEKSAGVSTGIRFTTLPDATPPSFQLPQSDSPSSSNIRAPPSQPPTTITALFNPMLGHMSGAYAARVSRDLSLCSRFDFNVYSYESEWTIGSEWWIRQSGRRDGYDSSSEHDATATGNYPDTVQGVVKARASTTTDVSLMWEGRIQNLLVSLGVVSNLSSRSKPIKSIGLELSYFSS